MRIESMRMLEGVANGPAGRILVVDDNAGVASFLADLFSWAGYHVDVAPDAPTALEGAAARDADVVVSDFEMPGLDGGAFYDELVRRHPRLRGRFILLVGDVDNEAVRAFLERTAVPCLDKPIDLDAAVHLIRTLVGPRRAV